MQNNARVLQPEHQFTIALLVGTEHYDTLNAALAKFLAELDELQHNGVHVDLTTNCVVPGLPCGVQPSTSKPRPACSTTKHHPQNVVHFPVEVLLCSDWKFIAIVQGSTPVLTLAKNL
jgi:hypothetical protein